MPNLPPYWLESGGPPIILHLKKLRTIFLQYKDPSESAWLNIHTMLKIAEILVRYAPMPLFAILGIIQTVLVTSDICTSTSAWPMMELMWFLMSLAHSQPYIQLLKTRS